MKPSLVEHKDLFVLHGCWWPGNARSQGISSLGNDLIIWEYSGVSIRTRTFLICTHPHPPFASRLLQMFTVIIYLPCWLNLDYSLSHNKIIPHDYAFQPLENTHSWEVWRLETRWFFVMNKSVYSVLIQEIFMSTRLTGFMQTAQHQFPCIIHIINNDISFRWLECCGQHTDISICWNLEIMLNNSLSLWTHNI